MVEKRVVILGAAGFIGSHLTDRFLSEGFSVLGVDSLITGTTRNLRHLEGNTRFTFSKADICDGLESVLDFASPASPIDYLEKPFETLRVGSVGVEKALDLAHAKGATFLLASTSEVYGDPLEHPQKETYWGNVNPVGPRAVYDEAKRFAEAITMAYNRYRKVDTRIARIFNTYGPRMRLDDGRVVPTLVSQALRGQPLTVFGDGSQTRSFCYVEDNVEGMWRLLRTPDHDPVNIGNPHEMTILEFARSVQRLCGRDVPIERRPLPQDDPRVRQPDITRARALLGWEPRVGFDEGMQRSIEWFRQQI
jgi:dTDP-glucose 4,6-dehydratase